MEIDMLAAESILNDGKKCAPDDWIWSLVFFTGRKDKECKYFLDNVVVHTGDLPAGGLQVAETADAPKPAASAADATVFYSATFDKDTDGWVDGKRITDNTFGGSPGALKAERQGENYFGPMHAVWRAPYIMKVEEGMKLSFSYYIEGKSRLGVNVRNARTDSNSRVEFKNVPEGKWMVANVSLSQIKFGEEGVKHEPGDGIIKIKIDTDAMREPYTFIIDNVVVYVGDLPSNVVAAVTQAKAITGDPMKDGFFLNSEVLANLEKYFKPDATEDKYMAVLGDDIAKSSYLVAPLLRKGKPLEGRKELSRTTYAASRNIIAKLTQKLERGFKRKKPEVLLIMTGYTDLKLGIEVGEMTAQVKQLVEKCLLEGVIPILTTLPRPMVRQDPLAGRFADWNKALLQLADERKVPLIEANKLLGGDSKVLRKNFSGDKPKQAGYEKINEMFVKVYRAVEWKVMKRGGPPVVAGEAVKPGPAPEETKTKEQQQELEEAIEDVEI